MASANVDWRGSGWRAVSGLPSGALMIGRKTKLEVERNKRRTLSTENFMVIILPEMVRKRTLREPCKLVQRMGAVM
jgi:hypothetical protein